jgi:hypothetical protein
MHHYWQSSWKSWILMGAGGSSLVVLALVGACSLGAGKTSEIDSYDLAVRTHSVADSRAFVKQHRTSHLVGDLIESLPPDVALQVCEDLPVGTTSKAVRSCKQLQDAIATMPAAPNGSIQIAASSPVVMPATASDCVGTPFQILPTGSTSVDKAKRSASAAPIRTRSSQTQRFWQVASADRGNKEVKH